MSEHLQEVEICMTSQVYDGIEVTVKGTVNSVANWLHENIDAGYAAIELGELKSQNGRVIWKHYNPERIAALTKRLREKRHIAVYYDDKFEVLSVEPGTTQED